MKRNPGKIDIDLKLKRKKNETLKLYENPIYLKIYSLYK